MLERGISRAEVKEAIMNGAVLEDYSSDVDEVKAYSVFWALRLI